MRGVSEFLFFAETVLANREETNASIISRNFYTRCYPFLITRYCLEQRKDIYICRCTWCVIYLVAKLEKHRDVDISLKYLVKYAYAVETLRLC